MANEKRLIDANALIATLEKIATEDETPYFHLDEVTQEIFDAPTVDAVEVVRCKDCTHRGDDVHCPMCFEEMSEYDDGDGYTEVDYISHDRTTDDGFCDRGERREGE